MKILILSDTDILEEKQTSSVAIRQLFLANQLAKSHETTMATTFGKSKIRFKKRIKFISGFKSLSLVENYDVIVIELSSSKSSIAYKYAKSQYKRPTIIDSHYAIIFEKLITLSIKDNYVFNQKLNIIKKILETGDHYICATTKQKDYLLGLISLLGKINPNTFNQELISVLPHTFSTKFNSKNKVLRKDYFSKADKIILFLGSIYPWFNPKPIIMAIPQIKKQVKDAKLLILGGKHPSGSYDGEYNNAVELAKEMGLYNKQIIFIDWVDKEKSFALSSDADLSIVISENTLEDEFAYRTRTLTPLLLGLPTITNGQDYISNLIRSYQAGVVLKSTNPEIISREIVRILTQDNLQSTMSKNSKKVIRHIKNDTDIKPLMNFLRDPAINKIKSKYLNLSQTLSFIKAKINPLR